MTHPLANSRAAAANILAQWLDTGAFPDRLIGNRQPDRAFVMEVAYGAVRWKRLLDWAMARCTDREPDKAVVPFLLVGLYQLLLMDNVEEYAAVNETVEAVKSSRARRAAAFVNAVLRRATREREAIGQEREHLPDGIRESHPDLLLERWTNRWGRTRTLELCRWNNTRPEVTIRLRAGHDAADEYLERCRAAGIAPRSHPSGPGAWFILPHGTRVTDLPGYADGVFTVQDPSTAAAVELLDPQPGERILDACAAPGGKTVAVADAMKGNGRVVAMDLHTDRLALLGDNMKRTRCPGVDIVRGDASRPEDVGRVSGGEAFDRVLLDVPCTNTGVLRRRPDARWRLTARRLSALTRRPRRILDGVAPSLKPGGILVYSTCSLETEEGPDQVNTWLRENPHFEQVAVSALFPPDSDTDGIFAAALRRKA